MLSTPLVSRVLAARAAAAYPKTEQLLKRKQWGELIEHIKQVDFGDDLHNYLLAR